MIWRPRPRATSPRWRRSKNLPPGSSSRPPVPRSPPPRSCRPPSRSPSRIPRPCGCRPVAPASRKDSRSPSSRRSSSSSVLWWPTSSGPSTRSPGRRPPSRRPSPWSSRWPPPRAKATFPRCPPSGRSPRSTPRLGPRPIRRSRASSTWMAVSGAWRTRSAGR